MVLNVRQFLIDIDSYIIQQNTNIQQTFEDRNSKTASFKQNTQRKGKNLLNSSPTLNVEFLNMFMSIYRKQRSD